MKLGAYVVVAGVAFLCAAGPAMAILGEAEQSERAPRREADAKKFPQGWAWQGQRAGAPDVGDASGIPKKGLAVAWFGGRDKLTYLGITGRKFSGAILELQINQDANNINLAGVELQACVILRAWEPAKPMAWETKPLTDCVSAASGRYRESTQSFSFDLTPLAVAISLPGTHGISIEPVDEPQASLFQIVFTGGKSVTLEKASDNDSPSPPGSAQSADTGSGASNTGPPLPVGQPGSDFGSISTSFEESTDPPRTESPTTDPESDVPVPVAATSTPRVDQRPVTFAWAYAALAGMAVFPLFTRVLAYALPKGRGKGNPA